MCASVTMLLMSCYPIVLRCFIVAVSVCYCSVAYNHKYFYVFQYISVCQYIFCQVATAGGATSTSSVDDEGDAVCARTLAERIPMLFLVPRLDWRGGEISTGEIGIL